MRNSFVNCINDIAGSDKDVLLVTGDLGYGVLTGYAESYPAQFINAGISEQAMTSLAAGMALEGKTVFTYSIANFPSLRCIEQIRNDVAYHGLNVKIVSIGAGMAYGGAGMSHHGTEDMAVMRALPGVAIYSPATPLEAVAATCAAYLRPGPCYIRLGKGGERELHDSLPSLDTPAPIKLRGGQEVAILATGAIAAEAVEAAGILESRGAARASVYSFPVVKPIDSAAISRIMDENKWVFTVEEHNLAGGFGGAVAEAACDAGLTAGGAKLARFGLNDTYADVVGDQQYLRRHYGLCADQLADRICEIVGGA